MSISDRVRSSAPQPVPWGILTLKSLRGANFALPEGLKNEPLIVIGLFLRW